MILKANQKYIITSKKAIFIMRSLVTFLILSALITLSGFKTTYSHSQEQVKASHQFFHSPSQPLHNNPSAEFPEESKLEKEGVDEDESTFSTLFVENDYKAHSSNSQLFQLLCSLQKRETISLIILHHSWKIFLG